MGGPVIGQRVDQHVHPSPAGVTEKAIYRPRGYTFLTSQQQGSHVVSDNGLAQPHLTIAEPETSQSPTNAFRPSLLVSDKANSPILIHSLRFRLSHVVQ
jgi:hypothetical protein